MTGESDPSARPSVTKRFERGELGIVGGIGGKGEAADCEIAGEDGNGGTTVGSRLSAP